MLDRYTDEDLPLPAGQVRRMRAYFNDWLHVLRSQP
jgi:hypothetical protein